MNCLNAAQSYAALHPPSLQGFLHWLRRSGAEVKREPEAQGGLVRIMTVHGAKGLQAPLVIIPDTTALPKDAGGLVWAADPATGREVPLWSPRKEFRCNALGPAAWRQSGRADRGIQSAALCRVDAGRGPAVDLRLGNAQSA